CCRCRTPLRVHPRPRTTSDGTELGCSYGCYQCIVQLRHHLGSTADGHHPGFCEPLWFRGPAHGWLAKRQGVVYPFFVAFSGV
ncbi:hypothetical protein H4R35_004880, partial [Dimargaris xerosporica]